MAALELDARLDNLLSTAQVATADIDLFAPITYKEECPLCLIPLPREDNQSTFAECCGKRVCCGCIFRNLETEKTKRRNGLDFVGFHKILNAKCAFCRQPNLGNTIKRLRKLMKKNNPHAFIEMAIYYQSGEGVIQSDTRSIEMYIRAAELGYGEAFAHIGDCYKEGTAVEPDVPKALAFFELAAKKESVYAHHQLALYHSHMDLSNGISMNLCMKHLKVAASAGCQEAIGSLMKLYKDKVLSKEDLTQTLRDFQSSNNEMKSKDRDDARAWFAGRRTDPSVAMQQR